MEKLLDHEYLFTVRVIKTGKIEKVEARTISGVALLLKCELDDIVYIHKDRL